MTKIKQTAGERFIAAMRHLANTVNVVTTDGPAGRAGVTVSAMSSISADENRPSLLICVHNLSSACEPILTNRKFCVNVLSDDQSHIADVFAGRIPPADGSGNKFSCADWVGDHSPRVVDPLVAFGCDLVQNYRIGTHVICVGEVRETFISGGKSPLIYANQAYRPSSRDFVDMEAPIEKRSTPMLRVGVLPSLMPLIPVTAINQYMDRHLQDGFSIKQYGHGELMAGLRSGCLDLAIVSDSFTEAEFMAEPLIEAQTHVLLAASHPLAQSTSISLTTLSSCRLIMVDDVITRQRIQSLFSKLGLSPDPSPLETSSFDQACRLIETSAAYSLIEMKPGSQHLLHGNKLRLLPLSEKERIDSLSVIALTSRVERKAGVSEFIKLFQREGCRE